MKRSGDAALDGPGRSSASGMVLGGELDRAATAGSLSDLAAGELGDDVEVAEVTGVLLQQVEQYPLE
jgi:hypothetical protein